MTVDFVRLVESRAAGVFRCHVPLRDQALEFAAQKNMRVVTVNLTGTRDKNAFLNAMARKLGFADYFGHNWDAFYDCLLDMEHGEAAGTLLVLQQASGFARAEPEEFAAATAALQDAADYWKEKGKVLATIIELDAPALAPELVEVSLPEA